jgi:hypothetical protein
MRTDDLSGVLSSSDSAVLERYCSAQEVLNWPDREQIRAIVETCAKRRWPYSDHDDIVQFVRSLHGRLSGTLIIPPLFAEGLLRAALGEENLTVGIPVPYQFVWNLALAIALLEDERSPR